MIIKFIIVINSKINNIKNKVIHFIIDTLLVYIIVILYIIIIYKINKGIFHIYFFIIMSIGYKLMSKSVNFTKILQNTLKDKINK